MNLYLTVKFIHLIAAMIYFALPFPFGRWYRSASLATEPAVMSDTLGKLHMFAVLHLNLCGLVVGLTGVRLAFYLGQWGSFWVNMALGLLLLTFLNLHFGLVVPLKRQRAALAEQKTSALAAPTGLRRKIAFFSAIHHTLVTLVVLLMVFRPTGW